MSPAGYISDKCFKVPKVTDPDYINILLGICKDNAIRIVVPTIDTELLSLSRNKKLFESNNIYIIVPDEGFVTICRDKRLTSDFFQMHDIKVPKPIDINNPTFPIFAKPFDGSLSTDIHLINSMDEITGSILNDKKLIFMECIDKSRFKEYTIDMYYGRDNLVKCIIPRERIEVRAGEINKGRTHKDYLVNYIKERFGRIEGCVGCICMQVFYDEVSKDVIGIEINPRFGGGFPLSYKAGGNYPEWIIKEYLYNEPLGYFEDWKDNLLMLRYDEAVFV